MGIDAEKKKAERRKVMQRDIKRKIVESWCLRTIRH